MADAEDTPLRTEDEPARLEDEDTAMQTEEQPAEDEESEDGSGTGSDSEEEEQTEWLATTRERRATAGNRLANLLQQEDPDDELELLFAEADDDAGFSDDAADSDVQMDSSSDDEDQGPAAGDDDLEGEKELQRKEKAEKAKKRKLEGGMPKIFKKRVKIDPTISQTPAPRPKKKSERTSWIPTAEDAPTRASQRGTTKQSKQQLHMQMVDREVKRLKQLANMEKAAAKKEAAKKPALTQEDRLKEAARVEKANSKSLSRWEQAEQEREEEQRAKLAALHDRTLEGPVITWWSGMAEWVGGKLKKVGKNLTIEEKEKPTRKRKAAEMEESESGSVAPTTEAGPSNAEKPKEDASKGRRDSAAQAGPSDSDQPRRDSIAEPGPSKSDQASQPDSKSDTVPPTENEKVEVPSAPPNPTPPPAETIPPPAPPKPTPIVHAPPRSSVLAPPAGLPLTAPPPPWNIQQARSPYISTPPALDGSAPVPGLGYNFPPPPPKALSTTIPFALHPNPPAAPAVPEGPPPPPAIEHGAVNYLILENFDETLIKDKNVQTQILFNRKFVKVPRSKASHEACAITGYPAKYRDPSTGLPYCNQYAYKEIQKLKKGEYRWSKLVGAYVGLGTYAARGVPDRFREALVQPKGVGVGGSAA
ncbi:related to VPS72 Component of the Swr1p complex that incorporates Htz1p into chromatin [Phialocephala subalpina]|uniref:Related to VPS72 Component of the Swr1p complex that incorporates Htz1p into chromatin n=1 Tax=Phialocephala subalpina TaxID=576137 RepID=A0A1L7XYE7_9HELO|nr:related to VPS72 Component of the Swr1p complex that incorporates Htz1p into chromatin [Phialocephala subalpina]